jgi:nucleoside-diphosphate-sugar epimerase
MPTTADLSKTSALPALSMPPGPVLVVGAGYVGTRYWERHAASARNSLTLCTSMPDSAARLQARLGPGAQVTHWNLDAADIAPPGKWHAVLYLAPPPTAPADGRDDPRVVRALSALLPARVARLVYVSTTAVYGDTAGAAVDEGSPLQPGTARGARRCAAEAAVRSACSAAGVAWSILRVPGIYGPGRLPLDRLRRGEPVLRRDTARPGNRIHVDDLVDALHLLLTHPAAANAVFNVSDGDPCSMTDYLCAVAQAAGLPMPPEVSMEEARRVLSPQMLSYLEESRLLDSSRIRRELGFEPRYATCAAGIAASLIATP